MADTVGKTYVELRKRAEKRGAEAVVTPNGVEVFYRGKTKLIRTHEEMDKFLGARADAEQQLDRLEWAVDCLKSRMDAVDRERADADPCWEGYEQRGTKEKDGRTVPNCVEADATGYSAAELKKLINGVDYAMTSLKQAGTSAEARSHRDALQRAMRLLTQAVPARQDSRFEAERQQMLQWAERAVLASNSVDYDRQRGNRMAAARGFGAAAND